MNDYDIKLANIVSCTVYGASNMKLDEPVYEDPIEKLTEVMYPQIRCYLHTLNLCLQDS